MIHAVLNSVVRCRVCLRTLLQLEYVLEDTQRARAFGHCLQPGVVELMKQVTSDDENHVRGISLAPSRSDSLAAPRSFCVPDCCDLPNRFPRLH